MIRPDTLVGQTPRCHMMSFHCTTNKSSFWVEFSCLGASVPNHSPKVSAKIFTVGQMVKIYQLLLLQWFGWRCVSVVHQICCCCRQNLKKFSSLCCFFYHGEVCVDASVSTATVNKVSSLLRVTFRWSDQPLMIGGSWIDWLAEGKRRVLTTGDKTGWTDRTRLFHPPRHSCDHIKASTPLQTNKYWSQWFLWWISKNAIIKRSALCSPRPLRSWRLRPHIDYQLLFSDAAYKQRKCETSKTHDRPYKTSHYSSHFKTCYKLK